MCVAVGGTDRASTNPLIVRFDGTRWSVVRSPVADAQLSLVACSSTTSCVAIGDRHDPNSTPFAIRMTGHRWTRIAAPALPSDFFNNLNSISCPSASDCVAVGREVTRRNRHGEITRTQAVAGSLLGTHWTVRRIPVSKQVTAGGHTPLGSALDAVSCPAGDPAACVAIGSSATGGGRQPTGFSTMLNPNAGDQLPVPGGPSAISCPAPGVCLAAGAKSIVRYDSGPLPPPGSVRGS